MPLACASFKKAGAACHPEQTMNDIFKGLLFLHGYRLPFESIEDADGHIAGEEYATRYGNRVASRRAFPPLGHGKRRLDAGNRASAQDVCATGACG
jgi:hypothetical protein